VVAQTYGMTKEDWMLSVMSDSDITGDPRCRERAQHCHYDKKALVLCTRDEPPRIVSDHDFDY
jgi:hypothetical protein